MNRYFKFSVIHYLTVESTTNSIGFEVSNLRSDRMSRNCTLIPSPTPQRQVLLYNYVYQYAFFTFPNSFAKEQS